MSAFLGGKIKVDGDVTKLMALQTTAAANANNAAAAEVVKRIQAITASTS
jgi:putative sterol carrier protein